MPEIGFVSRQIAIHQAYHSKRVSVATAAARLQAALETLDSIASSKEWSQRKLASELGMPESTFRKIKRGHTDPRDWLPKLQSAATRLTPA